MRLPSAVGTFAFACLLLVACGAPPRPDGGADASIDATTSQDGARDSAIDTMPETAAPGPLGAACTRDADCVSGICLSVGRCSRTCATAGDCPRSPNWSCVGLPGRGTVCDCSPTSTSDLPCNMIDDDCNGEADDTSRTCAGSCVDIGSNSANCGGCGIVCGGGTACISARCECPTDHPTICGTRCVATQTDPANCGSCGHVCPAGAGGTATCTAGACALTCMPGTADCDGDVANGCEAIVRSDLANCGACGHACAFANASATCSTGVCVLGACTAGFTNCDGDPSNGCEADTATSVTSCGACGRACAPSHGIGACAAGVCDLAACDAGFANCNTLAIDGCEAELQTDPRNCSVCGRACPGTGAPNTLASCTAGACSFACTTGYGDCDGSTANGCETSVVSNVAHCGACGRACGAGQVCNAGVCELPCGGVPGLTQCGASCVDLATDPANCGACGATCPAPRICAAAACGCPSGRTYCGSSCVDLNTDPANCGACGTPCLGGRVCGAGVCACPTGTTVCGGVCVNLASDPANCGGCGVACGAPRTCSGSVCACPAGRTYCSGSCVDLTSDSNNCGACGVVCTLPMRCSASACRLVAPPNDECVNASPVSITAGSTTVITDSSALATSSSLGCSPGPDVWYAVTLAQPGILYVDTFGSAFDTTITVVSTCGTTPPACSNDACGTTQSQAAVFLTTGTHRLLIDSAVAGGAITAHVQFVPAPARSDGPVAMGSSTIMDTTVGGATTTLTCGGTAAPGHRYHWLTCPTSLAGTLTATTCSGATYDTVLQLSHGEGVATCNDDSCSTLQSTINAPVAAGAGLHVLFVKQYSTSTVGGPYSIFVTRP